MKITNQINTLEWHPSRRWSGRNLEQIKKIILHQELAEGDCASVNHYHIGPNHISPQGCPHFCYHYGIEKDGSIIQANDLKDITWHTTGQNSDSIGIMVAGNFKGTGYELGREKPEPVQMESLGWLVDYLNSAFKFSNQDLFGHYHFGKPACPGFAIQEWIEDRRRKLVAENTVFSVSELQKHLDFLGYKCGNADGILGVKTTAAIRLFQKAEGLTVDGVAGPVTWKRILEKLNGQ